MNAKSYARYCTLEEFNKIQSLFDGKSEYYNGDVWLIPCTSSPHDNIVLNLKSEIKTRLDESNFSVKTDYIEIHFDGKKIYKFKPDISIICINDIDTLSAESNTSKPKVIFEIVTPGRKAAIRDKQLKYNIYEKYGISEYNIIEENGFIIQHLLKDGYYQIVNVFKGNEDFESIMFPELIINLNSIFKGANNE